MNPRGKTKISQFSRQSTYSTNLAERTTLTHLEDLKPESALYGDETFVSSLDAAVSPVKKRGGQSVHFENASCNNSSEEEAIAPPNRMCVSQEELRNRLYQNAQKNEAMKVIRNQEAHSAMVLNKTVSSIEALEKQV